MSNVKNCFFTMILFLVTGVSFAAPRMNVLFVIGDDWGGPYASSYTGLYGRTLPSDVVKTPNIDRVAHNGMIFRNAYVNAPSCTPSRSSLLSGRYFFNTGLGAILNGQWDFSIPSFPILLRASGYHVGKTFKAWSPGSPADGPFVGATGKTFVYEQKGSQANNYSENVTNLMAGGLALDQAKQRILAQVKGNFEEFLNKRSPGQPFFYWFGPSNTHRDWVKGSGKRLWGINPDMLKGKFRIFIPDTPETRADMADYLGEIQALDAYVGILLQKLEAINELKNTLIVLTGDNGPGGFPRGKWNLYDFGVATPLVVWWPGGKGNRVVDDFVSLMDLAPTFLEIGGVSLPPKINGRSIVNIFKSPNSGQIDPSRNYVITGEERHVGMAREKSLPYPARALRNKDFLYIRNFAPDRWPMGCPYTARPAPNPPYIFIDMDPSPTKDWIIGHRHITGSSGYYNLAFSKRPLEELYDLKKDPGQIINVASSPGYAAQKNQLATELINKLKIAGDPRVTGNGQIFDNPPYTSLAPVSCAFLP